LHMQPARVAFEDIDAPLISAFLDELQNSRRITARSRNIRLAAVRSFFNFAASDLVPWPVADATAGDRGGRLSRYCGHHAYL
jgi:hypothetical protein